MTWLKNALIDVLLWHALMCAWFALGVILVVAMICATPAFCIATVIERLRK